MKKTFVAIATYGRYEDAETEVIYAGESAEDAEKACVEFKFPDDANNRVGFQVWENGKNVLYVPIG